MTPPEELIALKPCPFCGGPAIAMDRDMPPLGDRWSVECRECDCGCDYRCETEAEAIATWNTRAPSIGDADKHAAYDPTTQPYDEPFRHIGDADKQADGLEPVLDCDKIPRWPPLKKAIWGVVTGEQLNDGHYINAYELTDKLYAAIEAHLAAVERERDEALTEHTDMMWQRRRADERAEASEAKVLALTTALTEISRNGYPGASFIARAALEQASKAGGAP